MQTETATRDRHIFVAKLAEQAERYDDMAENMKKAVEMSEQPLTVDERNLLSVAYKNAVGTRRASLRILSSAEERHRKKGNVMQSEVAKGYCKQIAKESQEICQQVLAILAAHLAKNSETNAEGVVFYEKMQGDYNRYACEFAEGPAHDDFQKKAMQHYNVAKDAAEGLTPLNPIRLGLALNFSVFYYEIMDDKEEACKMAQKAFDTAMADVTNEGDRDHEDKKDSNLILQLLRDNLQLWLNEKEAMSAAKAAAAPPAAGEPQA